MNIKSEEERAMNLAELKIYFDILVMLATFFVFAIICVLTFMVQFKKYEKSSAIYKKISVLALIILGVSAYLFVFGPFQFLASTRQITFLLVVWFAVAFMCHKEYERLKNDPTG